MVNKKTSTSKHNFTFNGRNPTAGFIFLCILIIIVGLYILVLLHTYIYHSQNCSRCKSRTIISRNNNVKITEILNEIHNEDIDNINDIEIGKISSRIQ